MKAPDTTGIVRICRRCTAISLVALALVAVTGVCGDEPAATKKPSADPGKSTGELLEDLVPDVVPELADSRYTNAVKTGVIVKAQARGVAVMLSIFVPSPVDRNTYLHDWILNQLERDESTGDISPHILNLVAKRAAEEAQGKSEPSENRFDEKRRCQKCGLTATPDGLCPLCDAAKIKARTGK